ncbi:MAG: hypothetical protein ACP5LX_07140, partial [Nitrososphaeria archaeon]
MDRGITIAKARGDRVLLRTYTLSHDVGDEIEGLLMAYNRILNGMLGDIWSAIEWRTKPVKGEKQARRIPYLRKDKDFRRELRNKYLEGWEYSAHWVDSALKVAFSIMESWRKNYLEGRRRA